LLHADRAVYSKAASRNLWRATAALREAETLAQLASVSGPADEAPREQTEEQSWAEDWKTRALESLDKARQFALKPAVVMKDRAKTIVNRIASGLAAIRRATGQRLRATLKPVEQALTVATVGYYGSVTVGLLVLGWIAWKYLEHKG
jgi:CHASE3 domain sensor protein